MLSILRMFGMKPKPITRTKEEIFQNRHLGRFSTELFNYYSLKCKTAQVSKAKARTQLQLFDHICGFVVKEKEQSLVSLDNNSEGFES